MESKDHLLKVWRESHTVKVFDTDMYGLAKVSALLNFFQESAGNHAEYRGFGFHDMHKRGLTWVLSRMRFEINRYPRWQEKLHIETWVNHVDGYFANRHFQVLDNSNIAIAAGVSDWTILDLERKRLARVDVYKDQMPLLPGKCALSETATKIPTISGVQTIYQTQVRFGHLDMNRHVNNTQYVAWLLDSYEQDFWEKYEIEKLEINYLAETRLNQNLQIGRKKPEGEKLIFYSNIKRKDDGKEVCKAFVHWKKRKQ